jgi:hypothetical protein
MRDYSKVSPAVWQSKRFNNLPTDDGRYLYLYLLTNKHQTSAGAYHLPEGYACDDLRWSPERYREARGQIVNADLIHYDDEEDVILITRWFKHNPPMSESHLIGIERQLERLPSELLCETALAAMYEAWDSVQAEKLGKSERKHTAAQTNGATAPKLASDLLSTKFLGGRRQ